MIITLLLISQVGGEWVQISQQHYRKPYRPTQHFPPEKVTEIYEDDIRSKNNRIYINQSLPKYIWKESDKMYPKGTLTRVQNNNEHMNNPVKHQESDNSASATIFTRHQNDNSNKHIDTDVQKFGFIIDEDQEDDISDLYNFKFSHSTNEDGNEKHFFNNEGTTTGKYHLQHSNKFEKFDTHEYKYHKPSGTESTNSEDEFVDSFHTFPKMGNIKRVQLDSRTVRTPVIKTKLKNENSPKFVTEDTKVINKTLLNATTKIVKGTVKKITSIEANSTKELQKVSENIFSTDNTNHENIKQTLELSQLKDINRKAPLFVTKGEIVDDEEATVTADTTTIVNDENFEPVRKDASKVSASTSNNAEEHKDYVKDALTNDNKVNAMENVVKFMKTVADTISRNTRRSVNSKVRYLQNLQDTILANIKQRIDTAWPDDVSDGESHRRRVTRAAEHVASARGHVEFPSSESALMTISFLTFAVYLIKLILQLIHAYKNKTMMVSPAVIATVGRTATFVHHSSDFN